jgi:hypothetical protein
VSTSAVYGSLLMIALAAVASLAVVVVAARAGVWLAVVALVAGWSRWIMFVVRLHLVLLPSRLAEIALDDHWKDPDWDAGETLVHLELLTTAHGSTGALRRARRRVLRRHDDLGAQTVALDRLDAAILASREARDRSSVRARLASVLAPTTWAVSTGGSAVLLLSETTPGPVLSHPWRMLAGLAAAGATGSLVTRAGTRRRSGEQRA